MARPASHPYTLGKITYAVHPSLRDTKGNAHIQARGYYRDNNNNRREVTASGKTERAAQRALEGKVIAARDDFRGGDDVLSSSTTVAKAADVWLDWKDREGKSANTMRDYRGYVKNSVKGSSLANLTIVQANDVARIEAWLTTIADDRGPAAAKGSRKVLSGILALAERRGAIPSSVMHRVRTPGVKPGSTGDRKCTIEDCDYDCDKRHLDIRRAFTPAEAIRVQETADAAKADVGDLAAFLFGTGVRIHEALHRVKWTHVDLEAGTVYVDGTKTDRSKRLLTMSDDLTERLRIRAATHGTEGLVFGVTYFHTKAGKPRDRNNVSKALRRVFAAAGVQWAGTHTFRRTVASWMDDNGCSLAEIANQLGHGDTNVTAGYLGRKTQPTRAASVMVLPSASTKLRAV
jgi:integrase